MGKMCFAAKTWDLHTPCYDMFRWILPVFPPLVWQNAGHRQTWIAAGYEGHVWLLACATACWCPTAWQSGSSTRLSPAAGRNFCFSSLSFGLSVSPSTDLSSGWWQLKPFFKKVGEESRIKESVVVDDDSNILSLLLQRHSSQTVHNVAAQRIYTINTASRLVRLVIKKMCKNLIFLYLGSLVYTCILKNGRLLDFVIYKTHLKFCNKKEIHLHQHG